MRIAISGSHRTGKSTLLAELAASLPTYSTIDEPYHLMEDEGHEFAHPPSLEDFEVQLERSIDELCEAGDDVLFDRCPVDLLAYIAVHEDAESFDLDAWLPKVRVALEALDLVVFVPVERRDRISFAATADDSATRASVNEKLEELLLDDPHEFGLHVFEAVGDVENRVGTVLAAVRRTAR